MTTDKLWEESCKLAVRAEAQEVETIEWLRDLDLEDLGGSSDNQVNLVRELMRLGRKRVLHDYDNHVPMEDRVSFLHPEIKKRIREIGERLWDLTKDEDPQYMRWFFECEMQSFPTLSQVELVHVWNGIGSIRA